MKKAMLTLLVAAVMAPTAALAGSSPDQATRNAMADCTALLIKLGPSAFATAYGGTRACISSFVPLEQQNVAVAASKCTAEQADANFAASHGGKTFARFYRGHSGQDAFARCVALKSWAMSQAQRQVRLNPARACAALHAQLGKSTFGLLYGTNANHANARGMCVSQVAKLQLSNELSAASTCRSEQADAGFAASHGGKTFDQHYGTNADLSNAFGKCVSSKAAPATAAKLQATASAAKACLAELNANATAFQAKYGTFAACVAQKS